MALEMFLSPLVSLVVDKAANLLIQQFCQMMGMEENRKKLHLKLLGVQAVIKDAEKKGANNPFVEACLKKLHAAAYEAVDVLDEFQYEALRQKAIREQPSSSAKVVKCFFSGRNSILFRQKNSDKLAKILKEIDSIVTEMYKFKFDPCDLEPSIDRETMSFVMESEVVGRDHEKEKIVNILLDPQRERENTSVLPIVGMGGLGKTTLAQLVYNHERVKENFQLLMWVCVSTKFTVINIIKLVLQAAQIKEDVSTLNKDLLQQHLRKILDKKRYLLVLDDVWNEEREKWDELKTLLFYGVSSGSIIIVTTRSKEVASIMGTLPSHDLTCLNERDSWALFEKKAFGARVKEPSEEQIVIGKTIVCKCAGLPLSVKAMGGLMGSKPDVDDWRIVAKNKIWEGLASSENIFPILKLSYDNLPTYMRQCFAFCAIFPQDYSIDMDTLIQLWMANDFIPSDGTMDLEDKGRHIFNELCWRSFFQDIRENDTMYGSIVTCKMHDLIHDLATQVAGKKCSTQLKLDDTGIDQKEIQHLLSTKDNFLEINILKQLPIIRTLLVSGPLLLKINRIEKHYHSLKSSPLRAFKLFSQDPLTLKESGYIRHLRYLDLSDTELHTLPGSMTKLYHLQTLKLSNSRIRELPEGMRYMTNLRHLFLNNCSSLKRMPNGLGQLKCLRTLTKYVIDHERGGSIGELKSLNLYGHLCLSRLENVRDREEAEIVNLSTKSNIYSLQLEWYPLREIGEHNQAVLEALRPSLGLKFLEIKGYSGSSFPKWMKEHLNIKNLKSLRLIECDNCVELPPVWRLPSLEILRLREMKSLTSIVGTCENADGSEPWITFPSLKIMEIKHLPNLEGWHERGSELISFPKMNELIIRACPKLMTIPNHTPLLKTLRVTGCSSAIKLRQISNIPALSYLQIEVDPKLKETPNETNAFRPPKTLEKMRITGFDNVVPLEEDGDQSCQTNSLRELTMIRCNCFFSCGQTKVALGFWKHFGAVEYLCIFSCNNLIYWPVEEFSSLKCLKTLMIYYCEKLMGALPVSSSPKPHGEDSVLPRLESLRIEGCRELVEVPNSGCMSLKELTMGNCPKLSRVGLGSLTKLKALEIRHCGNWRALLDNMGHLPSLENLDISDCPGIESFPEGLQQRLASLQSLCIWLCPALEKRCRRGGDYWHLVSRIPQLEIGYDDLIEENTKRGSFFSKILPACGRS